MAVSAIEKELGYRFKDTALMQTALVHSSYANENAKDDVRDNERLEFLGDAVLSLCVAHMLMACFPEMKEGYLSKARASLVNSSSLARIARSIGLQDHLMLGKGEEQTNGRNKNSILADAFEAIIGAVYLDGGFNAAFDVVKGKFGKTIQSGLDPTRVESAKNILQEFMQAEYKESPTYEILDETGPDHEKTFRCLVRAGGITAQGSGKSKKAAQEAAARKALDILNEETGKCRQGPGHL